LINKLFVLYIFIFFAGSLTASRSYAQQSRQDSINQARQRILDSTRQARAQYLDSVRLVRQHVTDSIKVVRKRTSDSLAVIRKYRESRRYKDSIEKSRAEKIAAMQAIRKKRTDSAIAARKAVTDKLAAERKHKTDSVKIIQKRRSDSLTAVRKYKESRRYRDSVSIARHKKQERIKAGIKARSDSMATVRKVINDSIATSRKIKLDSIAVVRKKAQDSLKQKKTLKADTLAKKKEKKVQEQKIKQKQKEEKAQLAFEMKIKKKHEAWNNETMLKKRWSVPRKIVQNSFTRYNYYFNSERKMDEALDNMQRVRKDNYDSLLALFPFDPDRDSSVLSADMDSIIQKASLGIQIHDPRTKWGDDLYLLLGQAYYYKGDYKNAATAFRYVLSLRDKDKKPQKIKESKSSSSASKTPSIAEAERKSMLDFLKHRTVHNEAILWLARTYTESHQEGNAESVLDLLETDPNFPESMRGRLALEKAYIYLSQNDRKGASDQLAIVAKDNNLPDWVRMRAAYINGQLLSDMGNYTASAENFRQVVRMNPKIDMDFYARKNLAYSSMLAGGNQEDAVAMLKKVLTDGKYTSYYEQVYYVMGRLAANGGDNENAVYYLKKGLGSTKSTKRQKALSFATLGDVYYRTGNYFDAKIAYDSAAIFATAAPDDPEIKKAVRRSVSLGSLTGPALTIHDQDSLLALSAMTDKEQRNAARRYIRMLAQMKSDSAFLAQNAGINNALQNNTGQGGSNWYFSNASLMQQGYNEFKRKWGGRELADNWRRISAMGFKGASKSPNQNVATGDDDDEKKIEYDEQGLPTEESLLRFIPRDDEEKDVARKKIKRAYVDMAQAYLKELEDYTAAIRTLDTLDKRFPYHEYRAEDIYIRYLVALRQNDPAKAQQYSNELLQQYGNTRYADNVRPTEDGAGQVNTNVSASTYYEETYDLMMQRQYPTLLLHAREGMRRFPEPRYQLRFRIMEAAALAGTGDYNKADTLLTNFVTLYPSDSLRYWADALLNYVKKNKPVDTMKANVGAGTIVPPPPLPGAKDSLNFQQAKAEGAIPAGYIYTPQEEHYVVFAFPAIENRVLGVKTGIADLNSFRFASLNLNVTPLQLSQQQGIIVVKSFNNATQSKIYLNQLKNTSQIFREYKPSEFELFLISTSNYRKLVNDKNIAPYISFFKTNYK
jgi:hypothetical protein